MTKAEWSVRIIADVLTGQVRVGRTRTWIEVLVKCPNDSELLAVVPAPLSNEFLGLTTQQVHKKVVGRKAVVRVSERHKASMKYLVAKILEWRE